MEEMSIQRRVDMDSLLVLEQQFERSLTAWEHQRRLRLESNHSHLARAMRDARNLDGHYVLNDNNTNHIAQIRRNLQLSSEQQPQPHHSFQKIIIEKGCESRTCSICLVEFAVDTEAICLPKPCGHVYHEDCIMKWLKRSNTCPLCRRPLDMISQSSQVI